MRDLLFGFVWMFLIPLSFYSAHIGVLLWIWVALLSPNELMYGVLGGMPFNKIVAVSSILLLLLGREKNHFYSDRLIVIVGLFGLVVTASYFIQSTPGGLGDLQYDKLWKQMVLGLLITGVMSTRHRLHQTALAVSIAYGFLMAKEGLIYILTAGGHKVVGSGSVGDNNGLALAILMTIPYMLYVAQYTSERWVKLAIQITAGLGAVTVIATSSRGGFVGMIVLALMLLKSSKYKVRTFIALGVAAAAIYFLAPDSWFERINTIKEANEDDSFTTRLVAWKINFLLAMDHPFLGGGPMASLNWQIWTKYLEESTTLLFPTPMVTRTYVAHSIYFQALGDMGFTGLFLFLGILFTALRMARQTRRLAGKDPGLAWAADLARAQEVSIVVYCVAGAALSLIYFELLFIILGMVSRTNRTVVEAKAAQRLPERRAVPRQLAPALRGAA